MGSLSTKPNLNHLFERKPQGHPKIGIEEQLVNAYNGPVGLDNIAINKRDS